MKSCSTCQHFDPDPNDDGWGDCTASLFGKHTATELVRLIRTEVLNKQGISHSLSVFLDRQKMCSDDGARCPAWKGT